MLLLRLLAISESIKCSNFNQLFDNEFHELNSSTLMANHSPQSDKVNLLIVFPVLSFIAFDSGQKQLCRINGKFFC